MKETVVSGVSRKENTADKQASSTADAVLTFLTSVKSIRRRNGKIDDFKPEKLEKSILAAFRDAGQNQNNKPLAAKITRNVITRLTLRYDGHTIPSTDTLREIVGVTLIDANFSHIAKIYLAFHGKTHFQNNEPVYGKGVEFKRLYSKKGIHPFDEIAWEKRDAIITNEKGETVFEQKNVEVPKPYSQTATNIVVSKYFRGRLGTPEREHSVRQMIGRVSQTITDWGKRGGYFKTEEDGQIFEAELTSILVDQRAAFNSPVWFNVGVNPHPQCSACFINSVQDDMRSILGLAVTEGMLFKYGSGAGSNLSALRSSKEKLGNSSGFSSGPVSFMRGYDAFAGVIKSGGKTRRAAKMVILDIDHPDIAEFVWCKAKEEKKAHALIDAGYDGAYTGEAYSSIFFQNANNSVRVTDEFMEKVGQGGDFWTKFVSTNEPCEKFPAQDMMRQIADAAWRCGDPGVQFDTTINEWHTCANTDRIYASNPCSEYMFLNDSACNLASINLMKCRDKNGEFDVKQFEHCCRIMITAQEILIDFSSYPNPAIEENSYAYRPLGLGYANLGSLLMHMGLAYDSDEGRNMAAAITSVMSGTAYDQSGKIAEKLGTFRDYAVNREPMLRVIKKHRDAAYKLQPKGVMDNLYKSAQAVWDAATATGEEHGFRNAQISVLAPTGTIAFLMDCDTTGIEPDIALVKYKWLVGGGMIKIVNHTVPEALHKLGYTESECREILDYIDKNDTIEGAPHLKEKHLSIFDCAFAPAKGSRSINYMGHIQMMAAVQPFISGAISKTVNMPNNVTVEDIMNVFIESWKLGLKAVAIYRDGCKRSQPLTLTNNALSDKKDSATATNMGTEVKVSTPRRRRLPDERKSLTHKFQIGSHEGFITVGLYDDGTAGEVFINMNKEGSTLSGLMDAFAISVSIGLQYGVPLKILVNKFSHVRFEPSGFTTNPNIRVAKSIVDYIFRWLGLKFLSPEERRNLGIASNEDLLAAETPPDAGHAAENEAVRQFTAAQPKQTTLLATSAENAAEESQLERLQATFNNQSDAPACDVCGSMMVRNGACYKCLNCGSVAGCS
ncbi:vitamin B12-dependent ribonucleotide reductase [Patescibacteria group bacterium]|nr:vitamin B12-dependent ribonucleotide reductase [Patescibacteria group bacterium]MBU1034477.1 vitamin B12-dependent ribonucleotide reductase [Patescibacteria group bacterium]MBU1630128.1 vitamin B12-dependent ribonucleotide reductase [Patescibacteria group bacterium]MBU1907750.1 vitamin B12-dependent ribonucleotide reductase [Patescibacteria group bacterium]